MYITLCLHAQITHKKFQPSALSLYLSFDNSTRNVDSCKMIRLMGLLHVFPA